MRIDLRVSSKYCLLVMIIAMIISAMILASTSTTEVKSQGKVYRVIGTRGVVKRILRMEVYGEEGGLKVIKVPMLRVIDERALPNYTSPWEEGVPMISMPSDADILPFRVKKDFIGVLKPGSAVEIRDLGVPKSPDYQHYLTFNTYLVKPWFELKAEQEEYKVGDVLRVRVFVPADCHLKIVHVFESKEGEELKEVIIDKPVSLIGGYIGFPGFIIVEMVLDKPGVHEFIGVAHGVFWNEKGELKEMTLSHTLKVAVKERLEAKYVDLVAYVQMPDSAASGESIPIKVKVVNKGVTESRESHLWITATLVKAEEAEPIAFHEYLIPKLAPGASHTFEALIKIPEDAEGEIHVLVKADAYRENDEINVENNVIERIVKIEPMIVKGPLRIELPREAALIANEAEIPITVTNTGEKAIKVSIGIICPEGVIGTPPDVYEEVKPGETWTPVFKVKVPRAEEYTIGFVFVLFIEEEALRIRRSVLLIPSYEALPLAVEAPSSAPLGTFVTIKGTVSPPEATIIADVISPEDIVRRYIVPVAPDGKFSFSFKAYSQGVWKVKIIAQHGDKRSIKEFRINVAKVVKKLPDLTVKLDVPYAVAPGDTATLFIMISNVGEASSGRTSLLVKASLVTDTEEVVLVEKELDIAELDVGKSYSVRLDVPIPEDAKGKVVVTAIADPKNLIEEVSEDNNMYQASMLISPVEVELPEEVVIEKDVGEVKVVVTNRGEDDVRIIMNVAAPEGLEVKPDTITIDELKPGESRELTFEIKVLQGGFYEVKFFIHCYVAEGGWEITRGVRVRAGPPRPISISISAPSTVMAGSRIAIEGVVSPTTASVMMEVIAPNGSVIRHHVSVSPEGKFSYWLRVTTPGTWKVRTIARYGDMIIEREVNINVILGRVPASLPNLMGTLFMGMILGVATMTEPIRALLISLLRRLLSLLRRAGIALPDWLRDLIMSVLEDLFKGATEEEIERPPIWRLITRREGIALIVSILVLSFILTYVEMGGAMGDLGLIAYILPQVVAASIFVIIFDDLSEAILSKVRGNWAEYLLWPYGLVSIIVTGLLFNSPFAAPARTLFERGYPQRAKAELVFYKTLITLSLLITFIIAGLVGLYTLYDSGLIMMLSILAYAMFPVKPLPGYDLWNESKQAWSVCFIVIIPLYIMALTMPHNIVL
ncbi:MAG: hypothetical protein DRN15_10185, partial [Thermoprotei archaeon]